MKRNANEWISSGITQTLILYKNSMPYICKIKSDWLALHNFQKPPSHVYKGAHLYTLHFTNSFTEITWTWLRKHWFGFNSSPLFSTSQLCLRRAAHWIKWYWVSGTVAGGNTFNKLWITKPLCLFNIFSYYTSGVRISIGFFHSYWIQG